MANKKTTSSQQQATPVKHQVCCLNCLHAHLHRYGNNPILAACHKQPQPGNERFPYKVEVAWPLRWCTDWSLDPNKKTVEQLNKAA